MTGIVQWKAPFNVERAGFDKSIARNEQASEKHVNIERSVPPYDIRDLGLHSIRDGSDLDLDSTEIAGRPGPR